MASPHVAGAAALAWSYSPTASVQDIKNAILYGADDKPQLISQIYGGKRLNIIGILKALEHPTISLDKLTLSGESGVKIKVKTNPANMDASQYLSISKNADFQ